MQQGKFFRFVRQLGRLITYPYELVWREEPPATPVVFLCRHQNQHGPIVSILWLPPLRFWCLHVYTDQLLCRRHFAEHTLSQRCGLPKILARLLAYPVGMVMTALCLSGECIPVYRDRNSFKTMGQSIKALQNGENVLLFPDIDYTNREGGLELYDGFLYLERFYYHATKEHLTFVSLYLDDEEHQIVAGRAIRFEDEDFLEQKDKVLAQITTALSDKL